MHKERINKFRVSLFAVICLFIFAAININYWAASYAESESEWDDSKWYKEPCGGLIVSAEFGKDSFSYDKSANLVTIHDGRVKLNNAEGVDKTETSIAIKTNSDNVSDDIEVGLDGVNIESKNCAFDISDDSVNVSIFLIGDSKNTLKSNGDMQPGIRKSANSGCLYISSDNGSDVGTLTSTGSNGGAGIGKSGGHGINGDITIKGGTINVYGGNGGHGDRGGNGGHGINGDITIKGGTINIYGGNGGHGCYCDRGGNGGHGINGSIIINDGTINVYGGDAGHGYDGGAGIGGSGFGGSIEINGGSISCENIERQPVNNNRENVYLATVFNPKGDNIYVNGSTTKYNCPSTHSESDRHLYLYLPNNNDSKLNIKLADKTNDETTYNLEYNFKDGKWEKEDNVKFADNYNKLKHYRDTYKWNLTKIEPIVLSKWDKKLVGPVGNVQYRFDSYTMKIFKPFRMDTYLIRNLNLEYDNNKNFLKIGYVTETPDIDGGEGFAFKVKCTYNTSAGERTIYIVNKSDMGKSESDVLDAQYVNVGKDDGWYKDKNDDAQHRDYCQLDLTKENILEDHLGNKFIKEIWDFILVDMDRKYSSIAEALSDGQISFELVELWATDE